MNQAVPGKLVAYVTLGYPNPEKFRELIAVAARYADLVEVGLPPGYAKYDGPLVRRSYEEAKKHIKGPRDAENMLSTARDLASPRKLILLSYYDALPREELLSLASSCSIDYLLAPDLLIDYPEEAEEFLEEAKGRGLKPLLFVTPSFPDKVIARASELTCDMLYFGLRPATGIPLPLSISTVVARARNLCDKELLVGFGLKTLDDVREALRSGADGIVVGSKLIEAYEKKGIEGFEEALREVRRVVDEA